MSDNTVLKIAFVVVVVIVLTKVFSRENFDNSTEQTTIPTTTSNSSVPDSVIEKKQQDLPIVPQYKKQDTRDIMAGVGFEPQPFLPPWGDDKVGANNALDDGENGNYGLHYNLCSPTCCSPQWKTPFNLPADKFVEAGGKGAYRANSYKCMNSMQNSGCLCMTDKQADFIDKRGGNGNGHSN